MNWAQIPWELRERPQWCIAAPAGMFSAKGKEPVSLDHNGNLYLADSTSPTTWLEFNAAATYAHNKSWHVGYMLHEEDPYACIDFDVKDAANAPDKPDSWTTREEMETFYSHLRQFDTYTEHSASGKGFHAWVRGKIGRGVRNRGIEVYSQERFIITTGDVVNTKPIETREDMIRSFAEHVRPKGLADDIVLTEIEPDADDFYILRTALNAENSDKFWQLWQGKYDDMGYPSQSEADLSLISMLTFYSPSNSQVRRMFRDSELGKREKAQKDDRYLNYTLRTIRARERGEKSVDLDAMMQSMQRVVNIKDEIARLEGRIDTNPDVTIPMHVAGQPVPVQQLPNTAAALARAAPMHPSAAAANDEGMQWPPGITGKVAQFIYLQSFIPVKEISIAAALGLMAGLCGKGWNINGSGLNQYVVLIGKSAVGKEAMNQGISKIVKAVSRVNPQFPLFVVFSDFASGPALTKFIGGHSSSCFVNICGEWGHKLKRMAKSEDGRDQAMTTLRQTMTDLYQKSGPDSIVGGIKYSDGDKSTVDSINGVAYSMLGEATPDVFYEALTETMMSDGFLSRFITIEYKGDRLAENSIMLKNPDSALVEVLANIAAAANRVATYTAPSMEVKRTEEASDIIRAFSLEASNNIVGRVNDGHRQMWNRAALKAIKLSAMLAVADHHLHPIISADHINWAIDVVRRDIGVMQGRIESGDVGSSDESRYRKLTAVLKHYERDPLAKSYAKWQKFKDKGVVTKAYLQQQVATSNAFKRYRGGNETVAALHSAIQSFISQGYLVPMSKSDAKEAFGFHGDCYRIISVPDVNIGEET